MTANTYDRVEDCYPPQHKLSCNRNHVFSKGAAYSKKEIMRGSKRPSSNSWTGLATSMWIRGMLRNMPGDHPDRAVLSQQLQENEKYSAECSKSPLSRGSQRQDSCTEAIMHTAKVVPTINQEGLQFLITNGPVLDRSMEVSTAMPPIQAPIQCDQPNHVIFDLRKCSGFRKFDDWANNFPDLANPVCKITITHQAYTRNDPDSSWYAIDSEATFTLLPSSEIKVVHSTGLEDPAGSCQCDDETNNDEWEDEDVEVEARECDNTISLAAFARALSPPDDSQLLQLASDFVDLLDECNEIYQSVSCSHCRKAMFYTRDYRRQDTEPEMVPEPLNVPSDLYAPSIPLKSAARKSTTSTVNSHVEEGVTSLREGALSLQEEALSFKEEYCSILDVHPLSIREISPSTRSTLQLFDEEPTEPVTAVKIRASMLDSTTKSVLEHTLPITPSTPLANNDSSSSPRTSPSESSLSPPSVFSSAEDNKPSSDDDDDNESSSTTSSSSTPPPSSAVQSSSSPPSSIESPSPGERGRKEGISSRFSKKRFSTLNLFKGRWKSGGCGGVLSEARGRS